MWQPFETHGTIKGRIRATSIPDRNSQFLVWTDQGLFSIWYSRTAFVSKLATAVETEKLFDPDACVMTRWSRKNLMFGDCGPGGAAITTPTRTEHPGGDRLMPDADANALLILGSSGEVRQTIPDFHVSSEAWAVAGFSGDGVSLVVADPLSVRVFKYVPARGTEQPRWAATGDATDQRDLYRSMQDNPDEDVPRLMYADWLEEHGDPARAEFIRLQCRLAERMREGPVTGSDPDQTRVNELTRLLATRWLSELPPIRGVHWRGFWRGFPGATVVSPTTLARSGRKVWAAVPVEMVTVCGLNAAGARSFAISPFFDHLRVLTLERYYAVREGVGPLRWLLHSPRATALRRLSFASSQLNSDAIDAILTSPYLTGLEWLDLGSTNEFGDDQAAALLTSPTFANLRGGSFRSTRLSLPAQEKILIRFPQATVWRSRKG